MVTKSRTRAKKPALPAIPESFQIVGASKRTVRNRTTRVPMLVLRGEWLKAAGFPIRAGVYVELDARGELTLHRLGLGVRRRLRVLAAKR